MTVLIILLIIFLAIACNSSTEFLFCGGCCACRSNDEPDVIVYETHSEPEVTVVHLDDSD